MGALPPAIALWTGSLSAEAGAIAPVAPDRPVRGRADLARLRRLTDREIRRTSPPELADLPEGFWTDAVVVSPVPKQPISLRVDRDVLAWFRAQGPRYQSRINAVLRLYVVAMRERSNRRGAA
jgi:uncharacterized protein (DUF4415 family)